MSPLLNVSVQLTISEGVTSVLLFLSLTVRDAALEIDTAATDDNNQPIHRLLQSKQRMKKQKKDQSDGRNYTELKIYKGLPGDDAIFI